MRVDVDKTLENFDENCFLEGSRNNDVVNWTLLMMMQDETRIGKDLKEEWVRFWEQLDSDQKRDLIAWEEVPVEVVRRVYDYYRVRSYDELEDLLIHGEPYFVYKA